MVIVNVVIILLLILFEGFMSGSELAVVSARKARLQHRAEEGHAGARIALDLANHPNRFLSTVQIGITLVSILAGAFGGAALAHPLARVIEDVPGIGRYADAVSVAIVVGLITYVTLVIGELVPKRLALQHPEAVAQRVARPMRALSRLTAPIVWLLARSSDALIKLFGIRASTEPPVTEEEVELLLQQGTQAGVFEETERAMVEGVFDLGERRANELMTPRHRVVFLDVEQDDEENQRRMAEAPHAYYPVCAGSLDGIQGMVSVKDLWSRKMAGRSDYWRDAVFPALYIPESLPVFAVIEQFKHAGSHLAIVIDEYGGAEGVLTLNDVVEDIVGDLEPTPVPGDPRAVRRADGSWLMDGALPVHEARDVLDLDPLPGEEEGEYETIGGFMMAALQRIPETGARVTTAGHTFEVVDMDGNRVDKVLITSSPENPETPGDSL